MRTLIIGRMKLFPNPSRRRRRRLEGAADELLGWLIAFDKQHSLGRPLSVGCRTRPERLLVRLGPGIEPCDEIPSEVRGFPVEVAVWED